MITEGGGSTRRSPAATVDVGGRQPGFSGCRPYRPSPVRRSWWLPTATALILPMILPMMPSFPLPLSRGRAWACRRACRRRGDGLVGVIAMDVMPTVAAARGAGVVRPQAEDGIDPRREWRVSASRGPGPPRCGRASPDSAAAGCGQQRAAGEGVDQPPARHGDAQGPAGVDDSHSARQGATALDLVPAVGAPRRRPAPAGRDRRRPQTARRPRSGRQPTDDADQAPARTSTPRKDQ